MKNFEEMLNSCIDELPASRTREAMRYSLTAGGKRLRPLMMYAVTAGYGVPEEKADAFACALEMIHTYSLIHDDLPAMDNDDLRRGKPTCHKQFDEATAILAGDGLLTYAFQKAASVNDPGIDTRRAIEILALNAGAAGMVLGQCLDTTDHSDSPDWEELKNIHRYKTGCLFSAALCLGALAAGRSEEEIAGWDETGKVIGLAFQVQDDILDVVSTAEELGKSNSDERNGKTTSVTLLGRERAEELMNELYRKAEDDLRSFADFSPEKLMAVIEGVVSRRK
ncbi:MAG: polyprenyl synthetase family protein [Solobacterium sp.]|nr:polyprenyl synthetase family protein [Solobacterium sp.]